MWVRSTLLRGFIGLTISVVLGGRSLAELMTEWFPDDVPGYDMGDDVTVNSRLHPDQIAQGVRDGPFTLTPRLDESFGYDSNVLPGPRPRGDFELVTNPTLGLASDWSRDAFGALLAVQNTHFLSEPTQDRTDATISAGGRADIGDDSLTLAAAHIAQHEDRGQVDTIASDRPIAVQIDDARMSYAFTDGRWRIDPNIRATSYEYSNTTILGVPSSQAYRDHVVLQGGVSIHYELAPLRSLLLVVRSVGQTYTHTPAGQPSQNSQAEQVLIGLDYDDDAVWRWRLLVGGETRRFAAHQYPAQNTLIAEAGLTWMPDGMTSVHAVLSRDTEDAAQEGVSGLALTSARLTVEHEYLRDLLFKGSLGAQEADFFQGGHQAGTTSLMSVTKVLNRQARVSLTYSQTDLHGTRIPTDPLAAGYSRAVGLMSVSLGL